MTHTEAWCLVLAQYVLLGIWALLQRRSVRLKREIREAMQHWEDQHRMFFAAMEKELDVVRSQYESRQVRQ